MKIQLISFSGEMNPNYQMELVIRIINESNADLILFPGHALRDCDDRRYVEEHLTNKKVIAIVEIANDGIMKTPNELFIYRDGEFEDMYTSHVLATAEAILDARTMYPNSSLAALYDRLNSAKLTAPTTPPSLRPTASPKMPPNLTSSPASSRCIKD